VIDVIAPAVDRAVLIAVIDGPMSGMLVAPDAAPVVVDPLRVRAGRDLHAARQDRGGERVDRERREPHPGRERRVVVVVVVVGCAGRDDGAPSSRHPPA
jgi:hypothetical protein